MIRIFFALLFVTSTAYAQDFHPKDPQTATLFSVLIVGGGHFYAGEAGTGFLLLGAAATSAGLGYHFTKKSMEVECISYVGCKDRTDYRPLIIGSIGALFAWMYGITESDDAVRRYNENHNFALNVQPGGLRLVYRF